MNFLQILQLLNLLDRLGILEKILNLLDDKGKETVAKTIADTINKTA